jgi:dienelactone hydrolase
MFRYLLQTCFIVMFSTALYAGLPSQTVEEEAVMYSKLQYQTYKKVLSFTKTSGDPLRIKGYSNYEIDLEGVSPVDSAPYPVKIRYYKTNDRGPRPLIVILPPILGVTPLDTLMAAYLAGRGYHVMICELAEDVTDLSRPLEDIDNLFSRATSGARAMLDFASTLPEVDMTKVGGFGASLGGIRLAILMGVEPRIKTAFLAVTGGNISEVMSFSQEGRVKPYREARMRIEGIANESEFHDRLKPLSFIDPVFLAKNIPTDKIFMLMSTKDTCVPTKNQIELLNALGNPEHRYVEYPHMTAAASALFMKKEIFNFLLTRMIDELVN